MYEHDLQIIKRDDSPLYHLLYYVKQSVEEKFINAVFL